MCVCVREREGSCAPVRKWKFTAYVGLIQQNEPMPLALKDMFISFLYVFFSPADPPRASVKSDMRHLSQCKNNYKAMKVNLNDSN